MKKIQSLSGLNLCHDHKVVDLPRKDLGMPREVVPRWWVKKVEKI
jgi:hypothetical protein